MKMMIRGWARRKIVLPLIKAIKQGISVERLAVSLALGITIGLIPLYGLTTLLVGTIAVSLRLNFLAMQVAHYIVHPLQLALFIPFFKLGTQFLLKTGEVSLTIQQYIHLFKTDFWTALHELWLVNLSALGIWLMLSVPLFIVLYYSLFYTIRKYSVRLKYLRA